MTNHRGTLAEPTLNGRPDTVAFPRIIAHRGAKQVAPENTLAAIRAAAAQGAQALEYDVSLLGDGTPVMHHDATLDRCTDRAGPLSEIGAADLMGIDAGSWFGAAFAGEPLATLDQTLDLIVELGMISNLEMKSHGAPGPMAEAVAATLGRRPWARSRVVVSSFELEALAVLRRLMPDQPLAVLYEQPPEDWQTALARLDASSLHIWRDFVDEGLIRATRAAQVHLRVYTVNDLSQMAPFRDGLAGIITDHPPSFLDDAAWHAWSEAGG